MNSYILKSLLILKQLKTKLKVDRTLHYHVLNDHSAVNTIINFIIIVQLTLHRVNRKTAQDTACGPFYYPNDVILRLPKNLYSALGHSRLDLIKRRCSSGCNFYANLHGILCLYELDKVLFAKQGWWLSRKLVCYEGFSCWGKMSSRLLVAPLRFFIFFDG